MIGGDGANSSIKPGLLLLRTSHAATQSSIEHQQTNAPERQNPRYAPAGTPLWRKESNALRLISGYDGDCRLWCIGKQTNTNVAPMALSGRSTHERLRVNQNIDESVVPDDIRGLTIDSAHVSEPRKRMTSAVVGRCAVQIPAWFVLGRRGNDSTSQPLFPSDIASGDIRQRFPNISCWLG